MLAHIFVSESNVNSCKLVIMLQIYASAHTLTTLMRKRRFFFFKMLSKLVFFLSKWSSFFSKYSHLEVHLEKVLSFSH